jgi:hypothetical protein
MEETLQSDRQNLFMGGDTGWDPETLREEARARENISE